MNVIEPARMLRVRVSFHSLVGSHRNFLPVSLPFIFPLLFAGCAAIGVVETNDPGKKLADANQLIFKLDRPLPGERLIREAVAIYEERGDSAGLAEAYRTYGFFFKSGAVDHWAFFFRKNGFLDKTANFDSRYLMSIKYFDKSKAEWTKAGRHNLDSNLELNKAFAYMLMHDTKHACQAYDASLIADKEYPPTGRVELPPGVTTFSAFVQDLKRQAPCEPYLND